MSEDLQQFKLRCKTIHADIRKPYFSQKHLDPKHVNCDCHASQAVALQEMMQKERMEEFYINHPQK